MDKPRLLDLFCCQGGAARGYADAGFDVTGVDIDPQPRYPFAFRQADAIMYFETHAHRFAAWHASPPCQAHTNAQKIQGRYHRDFILPTRRMFEEANRDRVSNGYKPVPYVIENVPGAPLVGPVTLCGAVFGIETYRHRLFETNWKVNIPEHPAHLVKTTKMGRSPVEGQYMHVVGNFSGVDKARRVMGMPWANRDGLREAIPPAYTEFLGQQLLAHIREETAA